MPAPDPAITLDATSATIAIQAANAGIQGQADGARIYSENLRYDYLIGKSRVGYEESTAQRHVEESGSGRARMLDTGLGQAVSGK